MDDAHRAAISAGKQRFYKRFQQESRARICVCCGDLFEPNHPAQKYCGEVCRRRASKARRQNLTPAEVAAARAAQAEKCAVCRQERPLVRDCDESGRLRGLLCRRCCSAMRAFGYSPPVIRRALQYATNEVSR